MIFSLEPVRHPGPAFSPGPCRAVFVRKGFDQAEAALADFERQRQLSLSSRREPRWLGWLLLGFLALWIQVVLHAFDVVLFRMAGR